MKINDILLKELMIMDLQGTTKEGVIDEMIAKSSANGIINDVAVYKEGIMKRESQTSTGLGDGIAMPHAKTKQSSNQLLFLLKVRAPVWTMLVGRSTSTSVLHDRGSGRRK